MRQVAEVHPLPDIFRMTRGGRGSSATASFSLIAGERSRWLAFLRSRGLGQEDAEDVLQSALLKAFEHLNRTEIEDSAAWFYRVLRNALIDHFRKSAGERRRLEALENEWRAASEDGLSSAVAEAIEPCPCFRTRLEELNDRYAALIQKVDLEGHVPAVVAAESGRSVNTVHVALHRARQALREELVRFCKECATEASCLNCGCSG